MLTKYTGITGEYVLTKRDIGKGSFSVVHKVKGRCAADHKNESSIVEREYAVKVLDRQKVYALLSEDITLAREICLKFVDEMLSLHRIYRENLDELSPLRKNLIGVVDFGFSRHITDDSVDFEHFFNDENEETFYVLELASSDLRSYIDYESSLGIFGKIKDKLFTKRLYDPNSKLRNMKNLTAIVSDLHDRKIVHRDIKPENILIVGNDFKLSDLGLAAVVTSFGEKTAYTKRYAAPECFQRGFSGSVYPESDVFSLACVLYELLALKHPFEHKNEKTVITKITEQIYRPIASETTNLNKELASFLDEHLFKLCFTPFPTSRIDSKCFGSLLSQILKEKK